MLYCSYHTNSSEAGGFYRLTIRTTTARQYQHLTERDRYDIEALRKAKRTPSEIAIQLNKDRRTIEREIKRGSVVQRDTHLVDKVVYLADVGQRIHDERQRIGNEHYSPDAVIGEIKEKGLPFTVSLCTKTPYNYIDRGVFLTITNQNLPVKRNGKKRDYKKTRTVAFNNTKGESIDNRPNEANNRIELGHWETDIVLGKGKSCLLVLTERCSRKERIFQLGNKTQKSVTKVMDKLEQKLRSKFPTVFRSTTTDNGSEFLDSAAIEDSCIYKGKKRTKMYYAHPYSAFERGSNEVANKLIRRFIPKGANIDDYSNADIARIQRWMNAYPRRLFGYRTAHDVYEAAMHETG